ncbi:dachshund homolog 1 isoform X1 [Rana temporaria]|uniref:dachshund homolog 1 isoform X1 n=1 Tax=Rana temporaria TaxID=8407 RepID=UPI001AACBFCB|nr:dachshund homolog 1 isoform X1 [Rana temporaria]
MVEPCPVYPGVPRARCPVQEVCCVVSPVGVSEYIGRSSYVTMAVPAALIPPTQLVIATSAPSSSTSSSSSSPTPSITPSSSGPNLYRPEPIAATTVTSSLSSPPLTNISSTSSNLAAGAGGNNCSSNSPSLATTTNNNISHHHNPLPNTPSTSTSTTSTCTSSSCSAPNPNLPGKPVYSTPSPVENIPQNNECRMVDLRGAKVASFTVDGCELICLPQAFDLFLKHLVGGLHTVYTKLKRLEITPVVCNVEQVRILRGLGAIQPGVNRCKLISRKDFETLYNDCTNASSRPGRPPKRTQSVTSPENPHIMPHSVPGLMSPGMIPPTGLTAAAAAAAAATNAAIAEAMKVKKIKLEAMSNYHGSNTQHGADSDNGDLNSSVGSSDGSWEKEKLQSLPTQGSQASVNHPNLPGQHNLPVTHPLNSLQQNHLLPNGLELPFMMMPHPLIPVSLPPASVTMAMSQMNHLSTIASMAAAAQVQSPPSRVETSVIKDSGSDAIFSYSMGASAILLDEGQLRPYIKWKERCMAKWDSPLRPEARKKHRIERVPDSPSPAPSLEDGRRPGSHPSSHRSSSVSSSPARTESSSDRIPVHQNGLSMNQMLMGLSPNIIPGPKEGDLAGHEAGHEAKRIHMEKDETPLSTPTARDSFDKFSLSGHGQHLPPGFPSPFLFPDGLSSIETLLTNIQGLLKVAIDNARTQEKQVQMEKTELKMELFRERELRETLEKQLAVEQKNRAIIQKRLKKEKKAKRKLQEALEFETKRREQAEQALKQAASSEGLRVLNEALTPEMESDRNGGRTDAERTIQDSRLYLKTSVMY